MADSNSAKREKGTNVRALAKNSNNRAATGANENSFLSTSEIIRTKCENKIGRTWS